MVTTSKATLALILVALVGCGPKPAPAKLFAHSSGIYSFGSRATVCGEMEFNSLGIMESYKWWTPHDDGTCEYQTPPDGPSPIDPNPYRFIGGQRYGEGWEHRADCPKDWVCGYLSPEQEAALKAIDKLCPPTSDLTCPADTRVICDSDSQYKCWPYSKPLPWETTRTIN